MYPSQAETGYSNNIITAKSNDPNVAFVSRVFGPLDGVPEDPVCGSAHSVMTPFWAGKLGFGEDEVAVKQVSRRGGELAVKWDRSTGTVTLRGNTRTVTAGHMYL